MNDELRTKCCPISHTDENVQYRWWNKNDSQYYCEFCEQLWSVIPGQGCESCGAARARAANYLEVEKKFQTGELKPLVPQPKEVIEMPESANPLSPLTSGGEASNPPAAAQSPTPRTDAAEWHVKTPGDPLGADVVYSSVARSLERELTEAKTLLRYFLSDPAVLGSADLRTATHKFLSK